MNKYDSYMIIVPHPDDDISVAGALIYELKRLKKKVKIVYVTNGDLILYEGKIRLKESIRAMKVLGVEENEIIFLGYSDNTWIGKHLYNCEPNEIAISRNNRKFTCALDRHCEFAYERRGHHNIFTRDNFKKDIFEVIEYYSPEVLIVNDYDNHPDHKAVSLIFDEVMGEILKKKNNYQPIILKKFAYNGVWHGDDDYYTKPYSETFNNYNGDELEIPYFRWSNRLHYYVLQEAMTPYLKDNIIYKALKQYKIELGFSNAGAVCSTDIVYWQRRSDNLCLNAEISVSSGEKKYINDFKYIDCEDLYRDHYDFSKFIWNPKDDLKMLQINLEKKSYIGQISIYENSSPRDNIMNVHIVFDNDITFDTGELEHNGSESRFIFNKKIYAKNLKVYINSFKGDNCGFSEFEIYENQYDESNQIIKFEKRNYKIVKINKVYIKLEKAYICIKYFFVKSVRKIFRILLRN